MPKQTAATAVRSYLRYLSEPQQRTVDTASVRRATAQVERAQNTNDPLAKVKALGRLERARQVDETALRAAFVANVGRWLQENPDATVGALVEFGVPREVLAEAGLLGNSRQLVPARKFSPPPEISRHRDDPIPLDEAAAALPDDGTFRVGEYAALIRRKVATARSYLDRLIAAGWVVDVGDDPDWAGPGKPPKLYRRARPGPATAQQPRTEATH